MQPYQSQLYNMSMFLIGCMFVGTAPTALLMRNVRNSAIAIGSGILMLLMIFGITIVAGTNNPALIPVSCVIFGCSLGATLGVYATAVTAGKRRGLEAVAATLGLVAVATMAAASIGLFSGFNWQGLGAIMLGLLVLLLAVTIIMAFVRLGKVAELVVGGGASLLFFIYLIIDFNAIVNRYSKASWTAAAQIAMSVYLDMVNLFIRLLPIIVDIMDALD